MKTKWYFAAITIALLTGFGFKLAYADYSSAVNSSISGFSGFNSTTAILSCEARSEALKEQVEDLTEEIEGYLEPVLECQRECIEGPICTENDCTDLYWDLWVCLKVCGKMVLLHQRPLNSFEA